MIDFEAERRKNVHYVWQEVKKDLEDFHQAEKEPIAVRHSFDGYGWLYADAGNGSDWFKRAMELPDAEAIYE